MAQAVRVLAADGEWTGTVAELLKALAQRVDDATQRAKGWPATAKGLAGVLRRFSPNLRAVGVAVSFLERTKRGQLVRLAPVESGKRPSPPTPPSSSGTSSAGTRRDDDFGDGRTPSESPDRDEGEL